jgi:hypothetical protein
MAPRKNLADYFGDWRKRRAEAKVQARVSKPKKPVPEVVKKAQAIAADERGSSAPGSRGPATRGGGVRSMKATAGGTGPKAKSSSGGGGSGDFKSSFAQARKAGKSSFTFNGKSYHTKTAEEMGGGVKAKSSSNKAAAKPDPNPGVKRNQGMLGSERPARSTPQPSPARPGSTAAARTGGPQGGRGGGGGTSGNRMRAAAAKAFWGNNPVPMQGPPGPAVQAGQPMQAMPVPQTARGPAPPMVTARNPVVAPPASAGPPPVGATPTMEQRGRQAARAVGQGIKGAVGAVRGAIGIRPAQAEIFQPGQQVPGARTGPVSPGEAAATVAAGKSRPKRTPQQEDEDDGKTLASFLRKKREGR